MAKSIPRIEDLIKKGIELFRDKFGEDPTVAASAPGRVNLIGEHVDYNDGFVLPMALPLVTIIVGKANASPEINFYTDADVGEESHLVNFKIPAIQKLVPGEPKWANYVKGVVQYFKGNILGFNAVIISSLPLGGGLSSSAALEVSTYTFLEALTGCKTLNLQDKATICQKVEHEFANVPCGIMDQFISILGRSGQALFLDCKSQVYEQIPFARPDVVVLITNSNVSHYLNSSSEYAERKKQCEKAAEILGIKSLRLANETMLQVRKNEFDDLTLRRARHVITEIKRTAEAVKALKKEDYYTFGFLMNESHASLRDDYNVSCPELDQLVEISLKCDGVFGARMTGAGFGGCIITLLRSSSVNELITSIENQYKGNPTFYAAKAFGGARDETSILRQLCF